MKSGQSLPDIYQTYPKSGHTFGGHTPAAGFFVYGHLGLVDCNIAIMKRFLPILILTGLTFWSCEDLSEDENENNESYTVEIDARLPVDNNGNYHLTLERNSWQTLHRVSGHIYDNDGYAVENFWVEWDSNLLWYLGDTLGYIVNRYLNNSGVYVSVDTSYIIGFNGMEVPTSNSISYSNSSGEINNMIAPVRNMVGDTMRLRYTYFNGMDSILIVLE